MKKIDKNMPIAEARQLITKTKKEIFNIKMNKLNVEKSELCSIKSKRRYVARLLTIINMFKDKEV